MYKVVNVIDEFSDSLFAACDQYLNHKKYLELSNSKIKSYIINSCLDKIKSYKKNNLNIINVLSCQSNNNWKVELNICNDYNYNRFELVYDEIKMSKVQMNYILSDICKAIKKERLPLITEKNSDFIDIISSIRECIDPSLLSISKPKYNIIIDKNLCFYSDKKTKQIPNYIKQKISNKLKRYNLI